MVPTKNNKKKLILQIQDITISFLLQQQNTITQGGQTIFFTGCFFKEQPYPGDYLYIVGPNPVERLGSGDLRDPLWPYTESKSQLICIGLSLQLQITRKNIRIFRAWK